MWVAQTWFDLKISNYIPCTPWATCRAQKVPMDCLLQWLSYYGKFAETHGVYFFSLSGQLKIRLTCLYFYICIQNLFHRKPLGPTNFAGDVWQQCDGGMPPVWNQRWRGSRLSTLMCHCHATTRDLMVLPGEVLAAFVFGDETPDSWDIILGHHPALQAMARDPRPRSKRRNKDLGNHALSTVQSWDVL